MTEENKNTPASKLPRQATGPNIEVPKLSVFVTSTNVARLVQITKRVSTMETGMTRKLNQSRDADFEKEARRQAARQQQLDALVNKFINDINALSPKPNKPKPKKPS